MGYLVDFSIPALKQLEALRAFERSAVVKAVEVQLIYEPTTQTQNRKPMRPNEMATWELRVGRIRVYYDVKEAPVAKVVVVAIGVKEGNRVYVGGKEASL